MQIETAKLDALAYDPANVRRHSTRNVEAIVASLKRFGQQIPLVVDANNIVRVGNARLAAMRQLGWQAAYIVRTQLTGADLAAYSIADNRTGDPSVGSEFDAFALAEMLSALQAQDATLVEAAGFSPQELANLLSEQSPDQPPVDFQSVDETIQTEHQCPKCGFVWAGSSAPTKAPTAGAA